MVQRSGVLIETYWNVKKIAGIFSSIGGAGINRNILECKDYEDTRTAFKEKRINRNILECKEKRRGVCVTHTGGINRNILECKGLSPPAVRHTAVRY